MSKSTNNTLDAGTHPPNTPDAEVNPTNTLDDERLPVTPGRSRRKEHRGLWSSEPLRRYASPPASPSRSGATTLPTPPRSPFRVDRPPVRPSGLGLDVGFLTAQNVLGPPVAPPPTPPRTPRKKGKSPASPATRRRWAERRAASTPPLPGRRRPSAVEEGELEALDDRLRRHWATPSIFVRNAEPDLVRPASRLEDVEHPEAPRQGPYVVRAIEAFPVAGANVLEDDVPAPVAPLPLLAQIQGAADPPSSPAAPFPASGDEEVDDDEEDDEASRLASSIRAPSTSGTFFIVPIPNQPSPPDLSSTDSEDGP